MDLNQNPQGDSPQGESGYFVLFKVVLLIVVPAAIFAVIRAVFVP